MARNDFHRHGLYKLGYCIQSPAGRVASLEKQHQQASDVGHFSLVHTVTVAASYDVEQALFDVLAEARPVIKREFFFQSEDFLKRALNAAHAFSFGDANALTDFYEWSLGQEKWLLPKRGLHVPVHPLANPSGGWIYITRVDWHREHVYRVSFARRDPRQKLMELDALQKKLTCQIGFHTLASCVSVDDLKSSWKALSPQLAAFRVKGSRVYFDAPLQVLTQLIADACRAPVPEISQISDALGRQVFVQQVFGRVDPSWAPWSATCFWCGVTLRFSGAIGARDGVECPACKSALFCSIGASRAILSQG